MMTQLTPHQVKALDRKTHISLTANAGSGKTFVLSKRFVEIILDEDVDLNSVVAITFTDKAAGELNKKIAGEIEERIIEEANPEKRKRLESFRRQLVSANISTIHSFCINVLKEFAPEAGIDANFVPIDRPTSDELIQLSIEETIGGLIERNDYKDELKYLMRFFGSKRILSAELEKSIQHRRIISRLKNKLYNQTEKEIAGFFRSTFEKIFDEIFSLELKKGLSVVELINKRVLAKKGDNSDAINIHALLHKYSDQKTSLEKIQCLNEIAGLFLTKSEGKVRSRGYLSFEREDLAEEIESAEAFFSEISIFFAMGNAATAEKELAQLGKSFVKIFGYTADMYARKKKQKGFLDFEDILLFTQEIIQIPEVKNYLTGKFRYIMIDEYQDTNELQYEIFMPILDGLKSGNLFVVGDEKQSIYMFRNAEPEIFDKTKDEISATAGGGQLLNLPHSFRMSPPLVLFTNHLFKNLFKNANPFFNEVAHSDLICSKDETEKGSVEILIALDNEIPESELVANKILQIVSGDEHSPNKFQDVAVLCRKRDSFAELEKSFVQHGIPYSIIGGKGFFQRQAIYDIYNYLSFLLNKDNDTALTGILRSSFFNVSDLQLYLISREEGKTFYEKLNNASGKIKTLADICRALESNFNAALGGDVYALIRKILIESGYWSVSAAKRNSTQEIANIEKLLSLARNFSKKSFKNLYDFTIFLRESIEGYEEEGQAQVVHDENTVKILTVHQAKGLEFKNVFLFGCNEKAMEDSARAKSISFDKNFGILTKVPLDQNYFNKYSAAPIVLLYNYIIQRKNSAETKRLLYVAATRAKENLFISGSIKNEKIKPGSFMDLFAEGLDSELKPGTIPINGNVEFMKLTGEKYDFYSKRISLFVPVANKMVDLPAKENLVVNQKKKPVIITSKISDVPKKEIISATKISMYSQCPVKYQFTYELGYSTIYKLMKEEINEYEFNSNEDEELKPYAQLRGKLIHQALKEELNENDLTEFFKRKLTAEISVEESDRDKLLLSVRDDIVRYYDSETYRSILPHKNYRNEFEIYCEEGDHYLYGIIDKLIIERDRLTIVDYKTDNITPQQLASRMSDYLPQLKFYAYILSKLYKEYNRFELRLIFLKQVDQVAAKEILRDELKSFGKELTLSIRNIHSNKFEPNLNHCSKCHFALERNQCIKNFS